MNIRKQQGSYSKQSFKNQRHNFAKEKHLVKGNKHSNTDLVSSLAPQSFPKTNLFPNVRVEYKTQGASRKSHLQTSFMKQNIASNAQQTKNLKFSRQKVKIFSERLKRKSLQPQYFEQLENECPYQMSRILKKAKKKFQNSRAQNDGENQVTRQDRQNQRHVYNQKNIPSTERKTQRKQLSLPLLSKQQFSFPLLNQKVYVDCMPLSAQNTKKKISRKRKRQKSLPSSSVFVNDDQVKEIIEFHVNLQSQNDPILNQLLEKEYKSPIKYNVQERVFLSNQKELKKLKRTCRKRLYLNSGC